MKRARAAGWLLSGALMVIGSGCWTAPSAHTASRDYGLRQVPEQGAADCDKRAFDDVTSGGKLFKLYCGSCHNARALGERPFANYEVAVAHMREQAYLTGKEYRQIIHFLRRWHDVGPPTPNVEPSPKRFFFSQPLSQLRERPPEEPAK